ncbi:Ohr family peroxiredoxin [Sphingomonas sp. ABOLD]|jgi:Ohr subfamily peroxiredoxin|uniref:Ohr subfamily peroxiredoxin n=1 Tax=Sphingomonas trueperi TaxID=53317 RepID=A0A7X5Y030_9SPHN|nr:MULTISPECIES: Ohr family peroxiredoxin [Sphingomonas]NJB98187.1 Ohr subfamily peroxiredoxin [Sphingomonas trueperi]RSV44159.1 Ohr family peroxiredoxin [Sphingomonas sp. ABOLD]
MDMLYQTSARAAGGEEGVLTIADAGLTLRISAPPALGGSGEGINPEQLLASGYATCFLRALRTVARRRKVALPVDSSVEAVLGIGLRQDAIGFDLSVALSVTLPGLPEQLAGSLIEEAGDICPLSSLARHGHRVQLPIA